MELLARSTAGGRVEDDDKKVDKKLTMLIQVTCYNKHYWVQVRVFRWYLHKYRFLPPVQQDFTKKCENFFSFRSVPIEAEFSR